MVGGNSDWSGQATGIVVTANQTTNAGKITMNYVGNDSTPPTVSSVSPSDGAVDVALDTVITVIFSESVAVGSVTASTFLLNGGAVTGSVAYNLATQTATLTPASQLSPSTTYTASIKTDVEDLAGIQLAADHVWSFTTGATVPTAGIWDVSTWDNALWDL